MSADSMSKSRFKGSLVALATPFKDGAFDEEAFETFIEWQLINGTNGFVPVGTTGESPTLSAKEHERVVEQCVKTTKGRVPVIAGAGSNNTEEALSYCRHAERVGADGVLVVTPYYNKPTQEGLYQHFKVLNDAIGIPIIIYNIPARSVIDMSVETMARLYELKNIVGVKDATANILRVSQQRQILGHEFIQLSGEDGTALGFNAHGGQGCISVTANVAPKQCSDMQAASLSGDYKKALALHDRLMPLHQALFYETNPSPVKYALSLLEMMREDTRLPLVPIMDKTRQQVQDAMKKAGIL